ncbi:Protein IVY1 [Nakaseomyces bracarensis]|uniref:Protein IVY1 n=1 Tax=Nakaseomyces bracarensis TaxID=273131 RepID=A0ABR4NU66_9SACH
MGERTFHSPGRYAAHLSEFYPIVDGRSNDEVNIRDNLALPLPVEQEAGLDTNSNTNVSTSMNMNTKLKPRLGLQTTQEHSRRASSVTSGMSSMSEFQSLVTKRDVKMTTEAMRELHRSSQQFSDAMNRVACEANNMAQSLEKIARLKGCSDDIAQNLLSAGGLFYLVANHQMIMSNYLDDYLGDDLLRDIDDFNVKSKTLENEFKVKSKAESMKLKLQEKHNRQLAKRKIRNLLSYRESLMNLQHTLDELETLKHDYYAESYELVEDSCGKVLNKVASVSRAQLEISENVARKGWAGGGLDDLLAVGDDPFTSKETKDEDDADGNNNLPGSLEFRRDSLPSSTEFNKSREEVLSNLSRKLNASPLREQTNLEGAAEIARSKDKEDDGVIDQSSVKEDDTMGDEDLAENSFSLPPTRKEDPDEARSSEDILTGLGNLNVEEQD